MNTYSKIIFVCMENTSRSPMAATIMQQFLQNTDILVESRGMVVLFSEPYNPKAVAIASAHGMIMASNSSIQLQNEDFDNNTLVLAMDNTMKQKIYDDYDKAINVFTISEFAGDAEAQICNPYGRGTEEYNKCFEQLYVLIEKASAIIMDNIR